MVSPAQFRALGDRLPEPLVLADRHGTIVEVNRAFGQLLNLPIAALPGRSLIDLVDTPESDVRALLRRSAGTTQLVIGALSFRHPSGPLACRVEGGLLVPRQGDQPALVLLRLIPRQSASARFVGLNLRVATLAAEARRRVAAEARVREEHEYLRVTLRSIGDAVITTDAAGCVTFLNPVAEALTGWTESDAKGRRLSDVFHIVNEETGARVASPVERVLADGVIVGLANHTMLVRRDGTSCAVDDSAAPILSASGRIIGAVLVFRDVSERRALNRREQEARDALEQANLAKDRLLAMVSHELRNPLNAVLGWARLLVSGDLDEGGRERAARTIERAARAQVRLVEDLLDLSRMTIGRLSLEKQPVDVRRLLDNVATALGPTAEEKRVAVGWERPTEMLPTVGDPHRLQQAMWNIVANSIKFTPPGGSVVIEAMRLPDVIQVIIRDTGQGIETDFLPYVFEPFRQQLPGTTSRTDGLGLGMAIVKQLIDLHGGTIEAQSSGKGQGATFVVHLPLHHAAGPHVDVPTDVSSPWRQDMPLTGLTILVVDDDDDSREFLASLLRQAGADTVEASLVREAIQTLEYLAPDLILSDIGMPEEDGFVLLEHVLAHAARWPREMPIVAVTGFAAERDRERALGAGFHAHVAKPVDGAGLIALVTQLAGRRPPRDGDEEPTAGQTIADR